MTCNFATKATFLKRIADAKTTREAALHKQCMLQHHPEEPEPPLDDTMPLPPPNAPATPEPELGMDSE